MREFISVVVPVYNSEKYLSECIQSILKQTHENLELILINDGSTDNSLEICEKFKLSDERIIVIDKENEGVSIARNLGIKKSRGNYILFIDSDDLIKNNMLENLVNKISYSEEILTICNIRKYYNDNRAQKDLALIEKDELISIKKFLENYVLFYKTSPFIGSPCNKLFKKSILLNNNIEFEEGISFAEDFVFNIDYLRYVKKVNIVQESLYYYRLDTDISLTKNIRPTEYWWINYKKIYLKYSNLFKHYNLYEKNYIEITQFMELALRDCIRKLFRKKTNLSIKEKALKVKYVWEDELTRRTSQNFLFEDSYLKVIEFFSSKKQYRALTLLLSSHSLLVDIYKKLQ